MANNLVVNLLLKTGGFSNDVKVAQKQINQFQRGCTEAGKGVQGVTKALGLNISSLTKFAGGVGIAVGAAEGFVKVMKSSQSTGDALNNSIAGVKGSVDSLMTSIATADFSRFREGLTGVFNAAKKLSEVLDQLGNTQMAFDYFSKENTTGFQEAYNIFKDPDATPEEKEAAKKRMKEIVDTQKEYAENYGKTAMAGYVASVVKEAGEANLKSSMVTAEQFRKAMAIDISANPAEGRADIQRQYDEYLKKLREYGKNNIVAQENLKKQYADVIAIHAMLQTMSDEELKSVVGILTQIESAKQSALAMEKTMNRALNGKETGGSAGGTSMGNAIAQDIPILQDSEKWFAKEIARVKELRDNVVIGTDAWKDYNEQIAQLEAKQRRLSTEPMSLPKLPEIKGQAVAGNKGTLAGFETGNPVLEDTLDLMDKNILAAVSLMDIFGSLGQSVSEFGEDSSRAFSGVLQSLSVVSQGIMQYVQAQQAAAMATGSVSAAKLPFPYNLAAMATVISTVTALFSTIRSAGKFAEGGIVGGSSFYGDRLTANVNSGEMILNARQQRQLWEVANGRNRVMGDVHFRISGSDLVGVLDNTNKRYNKIR